MSKNMNMAVMASQSDLRRVFSVFPTGVVAVCAMVEGRPVGFAVNSFNSVSLKPPLVSICVARTSTTWPLLAQAPRLGLSVLGAQHGGLCRKLASRSADRFKDEAWTVSNDGAVLIDGAALWLECSMSANFTAGDHDIVVFDVREAQLFDAVKPLVFHHSQFRELMNEECVPTQCA